MITPIYIDDDIAAFDKPPGLATIPERLPTADSLLRAAEAALGQRLFIVHRLDKEVSGLVLFARHAGAHRYLNLLFSGREVAKRYLLLALGRIDSAGGVIEAPIRQFGSGRMGVDPVAGKASSTGYTRLKCYAGTTLVHAFPHTGRRHQLRVHFYSIGHPIAGDSRYGEKELQAAWPRLLLHAEGIEYTSPAGKGVSLSVSPPSSFTEVLARLESEESATIPSRGEK